MKKIILIIVLSLLAMFACAFGIIACGGGGENSGGTGGGDDTPNECTHSYSNYVYNDDATCVTDGTETGKCLYCDETDTRTSAEHLKTGIHVYGTYEYNNDATCVADGTETAKCLYCDKTDTKASVAHRKTGIHVYESYEYNGDATCAADGTETAKCLYCDKTDTQISLEHLKTGLHSFNGYMCSVCGDYSPTTPITEGLSYAEIKKNGVCVAYEVSGIGSVTDTEIIIPRTYEGKPVTSIGYRAFYHCSSLTSVVIPNSVTSIGGYAFSGCSSLTSIEIPISVTYIEQGAFYDCSSITSIVIPNGVTSIGLVAFENCSSITSIVIPNGVTSIGGRAFRNCNSLTSIVISDTVTSIGAWAFENTAYYNNESNWENGVLYIDNHFISVETTISGAYTIKQGTLTIAANAFADCSSLTSIEIPNSVTSIGGSAFGGCSSLTSIEIPNSVTSIGEMVSYNCSSLTIYCEADGKPRGWDRRWNYYTSFDSCPVVWDCKNNDKDANGYAYAVIDGVRYSLKDGVATVIKQPSNISGAIIILSTVTYKNETYSVTSIENSAFENCSSITSVTIGNRVTSIGGSAFYGCSSLTSVTIGNRVTSIGNSAFSGCNSLTSIEIPISVTSIGDAAFYCRSLTMYCEAESKPSSWSSSWNSTGDEIVWDCKNNDKDEYGYAYAVIDGIRYSLKDGVATIIKQPINISGAITIPSTVTYKNEVYSVTSIDGNAFRDCNSLTSVAIGGRVKSIEGSAFYGCSSLTSVTMQHSVTSIGENAFWSCHSLTSIEIPSSVTSIGMHAFGCFDCRTTRTIYCEASKKPDGWAYSWCSGSDIRIVWNHRII